MLNMHFQKCLFLICDTMKHIATIHPYPVKIIPLRFNAIFTRFNRSFMIPKGQKFRVIFFLFSHLSYPLS